jgi:hypothetical protein
VTMGRGVDQPPAAIAAASERNHIGFGTGFIDEDSLADVRLGRHSRHSVRAWATSGRFRSAACRIFF